MTQILPPDDAFAAGSPAYGGIATGFLPLYLGFKPWHTTAVSGVWLPNGRGPAVPTRPLHGAYQSTDSFGIHDYNAAFHDSGTGTVAHADSRSPSGAVFRAPFGADVVVSGAFEMRALLGNPLLGDLAPRGVFARAQGGTLSGDGTADPEIRDVNNASCYFAAAYQKQSDSTLRFGIWKFVAGAVTIIGESTAISTTGIQLTGLLTIKLNVTGTAIFGTVVGFGTSSVLRLPGSGTFTDSSVAGAGRCGFFMGADREPAAGRKQVDLCHLLAVDESGVRKLQDEFRRVSLAAAKQTTADAMGTVGSGYLSSAFYWDAGTFDGSAVVGGKTYAGARKLRRNATANRVEMDHQVTDDDVNAGRLLLSQRPADSLVSHHRKAKFVIPTAPAAATGEVWVGLALRATAQYALDENPNTPAGAGPTFPGNGTSGTAPACYLLVCRGVSSTQVIWNLKRLNTNAAAGNPAGHFPIATLTENSPFTTFPGYGSQFELELEAYPRNIGDPLGHVELVCKLDGAALNMALSVSGVSAGMLNPSAGVFVDNSGTRIRQGQGEGLVMANGYLRSGSAAADIDPSIEAWTQGTLTNAEVLDRDQGSVVIASEGAAVGTALDTIIGPDWPFEVEYRSHTVSNLFESGHRQTMPRFDGPRRIGYRFRKHGVRRTELDALIVHWNAHKGLELPFNFTAPGDAAAKVHYVDDSLTYRMIAAGAWEVEFELEGLV